MTSSIKRKDTPETTVIVKNYATRLSMKNVNIFTPNDVIKLYRTVTLHDS